VGEILEALRGRNPTRLEICFAGAGHAAEAISLAAEGALVTVVDTSASMLEVFQRKLSQTSDDTKARVKIIHDDIRNVPDRYDWVVANFFLNVFSEPEMVKMVDTLLERCHLDGSLVVGYFYCYAVGNGLERILQKMNWALALANFRLLVKMPNTLSMTTESL
jgi:SAM-dependent methyltransferase